MATEIHAGKYKGTVLDYGIGVTKNENAQIMVLFEIEDADKQRHEITWYGSLKEGKAQEITLKALLNMGMRGNDIDALAEGVTSNILDVNTPVQLDIIREPKQNGSGTFAKVQWVNRMGGSAFQSKLTRDAARVKLGTMNLKAQLAALRQDMGVKDQPRQPVDTGTNFSDDLPF